MARRGLPFELSIAQPCKESWAAMHGDGQSRRCESCSKQVHNLAAMTGREVEALVMKSRGRFCARITRDSAGTLVTLDGRSKASLVAQMAASAIFALGTAGAAAQQRDGSKAFLKGQVLTADGSEPAGNIAVVLLREGKRVVVVTTDDQGQYTIAAVPGVYDVDVIDSGELHSQIRAAELHAGEQELHRIRLPELPEVRPEALVGEVVPDGYMYRMPFKEALRLTVEHPVIAFKYPRMTLRNLFSWM